MDIVHDILDGIGMIPFIGWIADGANGILYIIEGDWGNALISFGSMAFDGFKLLRHGHKAGNGCRRLLWPGCFAAGTLVATAAGLVPIEHVRPGDLVWSFDHEAQSWELREVEGVSARLFVGDLVTIEFVIDDGDGDGDETPETDATDEIAFDRIIATGNHPFWVVAGEDLDDRPESEELDHPERTLRTEAGSRWVDARWLRLGDAFLTRTGKSATVVGLTIRIEREMVYNLTVRTNHAYAVGDLGVLVHNNACHRNARRYVGDTEVYAIIRPDGSIWKFGVTSVGRNGRGVPHRVERQLRQLQRRYGGRWSWEPIHKYRNRSDALDLEKWLIRWWRTGGYGRLPGNIRHNPPIIMGVGSSIGGI